ncbi:MAG: hypothetical protein ACE5HM_00685, partial [Acidiferrobacterales bacterium]
MKAVFEFLFSIITTSATAFRPAVRKLRQLGHLLLALGLALVPIAGKAGDLNLSSAPLFLGTSVEPNITFVSDDSGSMDWDVTILGNQGRFTITGQNRTRTYSYVMCNKGANDYCRSFGGKWDNNYAWYWSVGRVLPSEEAVIAAWGSAPYGVWRARFSGYNVQYYNPEITYTPWPGVDSSGTAFGNINPALALLDPYNPGGLTADLSNNFSYRSHQVPRPFSGGYITLDVNNYYPARYYLWTDSDSDGVVDPNDVHTRIEIRSGNEPFVHTSGNRGDCVNPLACTYAEEMQNFANWFSYYRRREAAAKNAIGKFAGGSINVRLAYATMHNNRKGLGANNIGIASMNIDPTTGNKRTLLDGLYKTQSSGGTPLRQTLRDTGRYYECVSGNIFGASGSGCPILPAASGGACQQNFTVLMTDGYWNGSSPGVANTD